MTDGGVQFTGVAIETGTGATPGFISGDGEGEEALQRSVAWAAKPVVVVELVLSSASSTVG